MTRHLLIRSNHPVTFQAAYNGAKAEPCAGTKRGTSQRTRIRMQSTKSSRLRLVGLLLCLTAASSGSVYSANESKNTIVGYWQSEPTKEQSEAFHTYANHVIRVIKRNWIPPKDGGRTVTSFLIDSEGKLNRHRLEHSSGCAPCDQAALLAVQNSAPFQPLAKPYNNVSVTFDTQSMGTPIISETAELPAEKTPTSP
jgi:TonB family protein